MAWEMSDDAMIRELAKGGRPSDLPTQWKRVAMEAANALGIEIDGHRVVVTGCTLDFAMVYRHDDSNWSTECSWPWVARKALQLF